MAQMRSTRASGGRFTTNSPVASAFRAVVCERLQPKASSGPRNATIEIQLLGAMLGSPCGSTVETRTSIARQYRDAADLTRELTVS
jgi:hypothetical protein